MYTCRVCSKSKQASEMCRWGRWGGRKETCKICARDQAKLEDRKPLRRAKRMLTDRQRVTKKGAKYWHGAPLKEQKQFVNCLTEILTKHFIGPDGLLPAKGGLTIKSIDGGPPPKELRLLDDNNAPTMMVVSTKPPFIQVPLTPEGLVQGNVTTIAVSLSHDELRHKQELKEYRSKKKEITTRIKKEMDVPVPLKSGYIYIQFNPAWVDFVKIGRTVDPDERTSDYQTYSPYRDYTTEYKRFFSDHIKVDKDIKAHFKSRSVRYLYPEKVLDKRSDDNGEWYEMSKEEAIEFVASL